MEWKEEVLNFILSEWKKIHPKIGVENYCIDFVGFEDENQNQKEKFSNS